MNKVIHYCWFGGKPLSDLTKKCIESWKKFLPDFKIIEWNENNFDVNSCIFCKEAYEQKKWAFVADYARFKVLQNQGGLYLDTDMEITGDIYKYLENDVFLGKEDSNMVNAAVVWAKEKDNFHINNIVSIYEKAEKFNPTGNLFDQSIPHVLTNYFNSFGYNEKSEEIQILEKDNNKVAIYPMEYFYPLSYDYQNNKFTSNSCMIHHFDGTWTSKMEQIKIKLKRKNLKFIVNIIDFFVFLKDIFNLNQITLLLVPFLEYFLISNLKLVEINLDLKKIFIYTILYSFVFNYFSRKYCTLNKKEYKSDKIFLKLLCVEIFTYSLNIIFGVIKIFNINSVLLFYFAILFILFLYIGNKRKYNYLTREVLILSIVLIIYNPINFVFGIIFKSLFSLLISYLMIKNNVPKKKIILFISFIMLGIFLINLIKIDFLQLFNLMV